MSSSVARSVSVMLNGEQRTVPGGVSVTGLLRLLELEPDAVAIERNREIVARGTRDGTLVRSGDTIEIVHFVGGG